MKVIQLFIFLNYFAMGEEAHSPKRKLEDHHMDFIRMIKPLVDEENQKLQDLRSLILNVEETFLMNGKFGVNDIDLIQKISKEYDVKINKPLEEYSYPEGIALLDRLKIHVDIIPEKLVLAQAIIETGWGTSKFAKLANNYFGIHCYKPDCGMKPAHAPDAKFSVKKYSSPQEAVEDYMYLLNTGRAYKKLRKIREQNRLAGIDPEAVSMAQGLVLYSERGEVYIRLIEKVINRYIPDNLALL
ncbi:glucosaminidase domain-containing protein [Aureibacter tunicatorum]|uniref:Bax protein n=1 Tax=Aureibacter tunicatorum TaxID=866807 RepID=A0AAE3XQC6_9BACT|nr:glucosaminidase domain-containing protein [Aureibacter tunicatorum]MDR6240783.1 Bax protein [Aureibacter tunicatorum]BDD06884.1 hypothetical protein AUTU_43670 [Aureibacter tunicatorum]